jgi:hypothetical protein
MFKPFNPKTFFKPEITSNLNGKRNLYYKSLNQLNNGSFIAELKNDRRGEEAKSQYINRSWGNFLSILKKETFYIFIDKAYLRPTQFWPGHIASFLTDEKALIIPNSSMSLREGKQISDVELKFTLKHDISKINRQSPV